MAGITSHLEIDLQSSNTRESILGCVCCHFITVNARRASHIVRSLNCKSILYCYVITFKNCLFINSFRFFLISACGSYYWFLLHLCYLVINFLNIPLYWITFGMGKEYLCPLLWRMFLLFSRKGVRCLLAYTSVADSFNSQSMLQRL